MLGFGCEEVSSDEGEDLDRGADTAPFGEASFGDTVFGDDMPCGEAEGADESTVWPDEQSVLEELSDTVVLDASVTIICRASLCS